MKNKFLAKIYALIIAECKNLQDEFIKVRSVDRPESVAVKCYEKIKNEVSCTSSIFDKSLLVVSGD